MRKIAVFSNMYPSVKHPTFGIFVKNQVELLRSRDLEVDVIVIDDPSKGKSAAMKKYLTWFMKSVFYMMKNKKNISVTHSHYAFPTGYLSLLGKKLFGLPYIITVHGGDIDKMAAKSERIRNSTRKILQGADTVIVVGERLKRDVIEHFGVKEDLVQVMSMGVNTDIFKPMQKEEVRNELGLSQTEELIVYVGNMIEAKGILDLVDAFKEVKKGHPTASLHLIGSAKDERFMHTLAERAKANDVKIIQHAPFGQKEVAKWIAAADVFVLPSHHEGFGLVALEAMAVGTTVVASDVGGLSYLLDNDAGILIETQNPKSLSEGINQALVEKTEERNVQARKKVAEHSYDVIADRLLTIYETVSKGRKTNE